MIDSATISIWLADIVMLGLAYLVGRMHGYYLSCQQYRTTLEAFIGEVKSMRLIVDRLRDLEAHKRIRPHE